MNVQRKKAEPAPPPPDVVDITGLSLREAGVLKNLIMNGIDWGDQCPEIEAFLQGLWHRLDATGAENVNLSFPERF